MPEDKMTDRFKVCSYYAPKRTGILTRDQWNNANKTKPETIKVAVADRTEYICEEKDGEMIVYQLTEIKRYKLHKTPWEPQTIKGVDDDND